MVDKKKLKKGAETLGRQAKQGLTFGFSDELEDVVYAAWKSRQDKDITFKQALSGARAISKQKLAQDWEKHKILSFVGQAIGSAPLGAFKGAKLASDWIRTGGKLSGVLKGAAVGAGWGGASGLGAADDTLSDRASGLGTGSLIGALLGGATAPLTRLGKQPGPVDYRKVVNKTSKNTENAAEKKIAQELAARPDLGEQVKRAVGLSEASKRTGIPLTLAEVVAQSSSDPLLYQQSVLGANPMTAGQMAKIYAARSGTPEQAGMIENQLLKVAKQLAPDVGSYDEAASAIISAGKKGESDITKRLVSKAGPLYQAAYQKSAPEGILQNQLIAKAVMDVKKNPVYAQELSGLPDNSIKVLDAAKRYLDDMAGEASRKGLRNESRLINSTRDALLSVMDETAPEYAQARSIYSGNPEALQMREAIGGIADIDPLDAKSVNRALFSGTQKNAELAAKALGDKAPTAAAARVYEALDTLRNDPVNIASRIAPDARTSDMLRAYGGGPLDETLRVIEQAKLGERARFGSPTQGRTEAEKGLGKAASEAAQAAIDLKTGGITTAMRRVASVFGKGDETTDPQFYKDMSDLMTTDKGLDLLVRVGQGQRNAIQEMSRVGLPSLVTGEVTKRAQLPATVAITGGLTTAPYQEDFYDIDAILSKPAQDDFSDIEEILMKPSGVERKR